MPDSQPDVSELAREVVAELEDTRQIGDQLLLSRREAIALSTGAVSLGALGVAGAGTASAQEAAGQIGTESEPVDVEGAQGNFQALEADDFKTVNIGPWDSTADKQFLSSESDKGNVYHRGYAVHTENVTSSGERIGDAETRGGMAYVVGGDGSSPVFVDVLVYAAAGSVTVLGDAGRNSPIARSYSVSDQDLMLAMDNDDGYDVTCVTLSGNYQS